LGEFRSGVASLYTPALGRDQTVYFGMYRDGRFLALQTNLTKRWEFPLGSSVTAYSPAVGPDGAIYFWTTDGNFYALNPDGSKRWALADLYPLDLSAAIGADGRIVVPNRNHMVYALNPDGTFLWEYRAVSNVVSSPSLAPSGEVYFGTDDAQLHALNADGTLRWRFRVNGPVRSSPAIGSDGTIYFGADDRGCYAVTPEGRLRWALQAGDAVVAGPVIGPDGTIYFTSRDSRLYAVQTDGTRRWSFAADSALETSACVGADGVVYITSKSGRAYGVSPLGEMLWTYNSTTNGGAQFLSAAVLTPDRRLLLPTSNGALQALRVTAEPPACNWPQARGNAQRTAQATALLQLTNDLSVLHLVAGESLTAYATSALAGQQVRRLELLCGTNVVAFSTNGLWTVTWTSVSGGTNRLWLRATDDQGWVTVSQSSTLVVASPPRLGLAAPAQLVFDTVQGRRYQVERSLDLRNWQAVGAPVEASASPAVWSDQAPPAAITFYRVRLLP
jgi:outer membrane protein assembly factor BamB